MIDLEIIVTVEDLQLVLPAPSLWAIVNRSAHKLVLHCVCESHFRVVYASAAPFTCVVCETVRAKVAIVVLFFAFLRNQVTWKFRQLCLIVLTPLGS